MTNTKLFPLFVLFFCLQTSCYNRFSCDESDNLKLGEIEYSTAFKEWSVEQSASKLTFADSTASYSLKKILYSPVLPNRLWEYDICESIDIKPYTAYAYYEYANLEVSFNTDSVLVNIHPSIIKLDSENVELIYFTLSYGISNGIKAAIPIDSEIDIDQIQELGDVKFILKEELILNNSAYNNIWVCRENNSGIYYSKTQGIIAIEMNGRILLRL